MGLRCSYLAALFALAAAGQGAELEAGSPLAELNALRAREGAEPVEFHPALEQVTRWRAEAIAASGSPATDTETLNETTRRLRRGGYDPHNWTESVLIAGGEIDLWARLRELRPAWYEKAITGDFEHLGVGSVRRGGQTAVSVILAITKRTVELRRAAPLADLDRVRQRMLAAVNAARAEHGKSPVTADPHLDAAAQGHADDMIRRAYYSHTSPEGESAMKRAREAGSRARTVSENIAKGLFDPEEVVERWLASPGHRRNILRNGAARTGAGVAFGDNANGFEVIWVQVFAGGR